MNFYYPQIIPFRGSFSTFNVYTKQAGAATRELKGVLRFFYAAERILANK